ncbi:hypothetical protein DNK47_01845 [Mycoplasma wenyonii]|uniref:Lipoprotein n=1 Tax=Mycoplasma wenyonii TaxID=65123 RepID=A0A328PPF0_9MOLU|nr:hypothetical protein [Mycoplasma wenyonii]RAO95006.1 hypothetical protein DNK47_01845 [Mycoplasma wenyonii]
MFLSKLLIGGVLFVGCGIPVTYELLKGNGNEPKELVLKKVDEVTRPILSCKGKNSHIELSLSYKKGEGDKDELYLRGFNRRNNTPINLEETIGRNKKWRLTIFGTGTTQIGMLDGRMDGSYEDENIECNQDVFEVIKWTYPNGDKRLQSWEEPITKIQLTLDNCKMEQDKKECDIKISEEAGLAWKPNFKSKVTFLT